MCRIDRKIDLRFLSRLLQCCGNFGRPPPLRANATTKWKPSRSALTSCPRCTSRYPENRYESVDHGPGDEIARLENTLSQSKNDPAIGPTAPQSVDAQLGYQPTPDSVKRAEADARGRFATILDRAKAFDAEGKAAECMQAVAAARLELK
jgi:hypothetical protein